MSYRPTIKTNSAGAINDFPLDAETISGHSVGYIEINSSSGTLTQEQYNECLKDVAIIKYAPSKSYQPKYYIKKYMTTSQGVVSSMTFQLALSVSYGGENKYNLVNYYITIISNLSYSATNDSNIVYSSSGVDALLANKQDAIDSNQLDFLQDEYDKTLNLFNKLDTSIGGIYSGTGITSGDTSVKCSGFIEIKPNTRYIHNIVGDWSSGKGLAFYNDKKVYISGYASSNSNFNNFTTPSNAKYIRISYYITSGTYYTDENTLMLVEGDTLPSNYIPHFSPSHFTNEEGTFVKQKYNKSVNLFSTGNWVSNRAINVGYAFINDSEIAFSSISGSDPYAYSTYRGFIPGKTYTVSIISNQTLQSWSFEASGDNLNQNQSFTFTATETEYEIGFEFVSGYSTCNIKIMINEGTIALPYEVHQHSGQTIPFKYTGNLSFSGDEPMYVGKSVTIPKNCAYTITIQGNYNASRPIVAILCYANNYNYQLSASVGGDYAYSLTTTYSGFTTGGSVTIYPYLIFANSGSNSFEISGFYTEL